MPKYVLAGAFVVGFVGGAVFHRRGVERGPLNILIVGKDDPLPNRFQLVFTDILIEETADGFELVAAGQPFQPVKVMRPSPVADRFLNLFK